jgi:hypothetical protein
MFRDWSIFTGAARALLRGENPYRREGVFHAPWLFLIILPFAWLPSEFAPVLCWLALVFWAHRAHQLSLIPIIGLSLPFTLLIWLGNTDWIALFGLGGVGYLAPFALTVKPQATGLALVAYLRPSRVRYLCPLLLATALAFLIWRWPEPIMAHEATIVGYGHNWSVAWFTWPFGLLALGVAWARGSLLWGCVASVLLTPYLALYSLVPALFAIARRHPRLGALLAAMSWAFAWL